MAGQQLHGFLFHTLSCSFPPRYTLLCPKLSITKEYASSPPAPVLSLHQAIQYPSSSGNIRCCGSGCSNRFFFPHPGSSESCLLLPNPNPGLPLCRLPTQALSPADPTIPILPAPCLPLSGRQKPLSEAGKLTAETGSRPSAYHSNHISSRFQLRINRMPQLLIYFIRKRRPE